MAEAVTIARPYAQALFRLAKEEGALDAWSARLQRLAEIVRDPQMARAIDNPKFSSAQLAGLFLSLSGESDNAELANFVGMLAENECFGMLPDIQLAYEQSKKADVGVKTALIASAYPLDDAQLGFDQGVRGAFRRSSGSADYRRSWPDCRRQGCCWRPGSRPLCARQAGCDGRGAQELGDMHAIESFRDQ